MRTEFASAAAIGVASATSKCLSWSEKLRRLREPWSTPNTRSCANNGTATIRCRFSMATSSSILEAVSRATSEVTGAARSVSKLRDAPLADGDNRLEAELCVTRSSSETPSGSLVCCVKNRDQLSARISRTIPLRAS